MKIIVFLLVFLLCVSYGFPRKLGVLPEIMKPGMIDICDNELFVIEGATIYVYSLKDLSIVRKFGKMGEGPGELKVQGNWANRISIFKDYLLAESIDKLIYFTKDGKMIKERIKPVESAQFTPVGKNFAAKKLKRDPVEKLQYATLVIYNQDMREIKELYRQKFVQQRSGRGVKIELFFDFLKFQVFDDKIFIDKSPDGFLIGVYDFEGKQLYQIKKEYKKNKVTSSQKEAAFKELKEDPTLKLRIKQFGGWENLTKIIQFTFPDFIPPIQNIEIFNKFLYVQTFNVIDNKDEYIVMDLKGKILHDKVYFPRAKKPGLKDIIIGVKYQKIADNKLYFIEENEDIEEWELHVEEIK